eukprot:CAMPEP_0206163498 /NCGR_PEP_ID=MMETSP1474-20131121/11451_1 /ASSEMBLY_ACC=CAM_ASM_001110 /TAXON_ID=97495 /ORGANISM="Imantonia sp., Strain RCC918" /LENGTH=143 /DNA_ID=CAMNT_0053566013 /DNA_START=105 /DNA_END=537 /DNA_ORIENTATION=-
MSAQQKRACVLLRVCVQSAARVAECSLQMTSQVAALYLCGFGSSSGRSGLAISVDMRTPGQSDTHPEATSSSQERKPTRLLPRLGRSSRPIWKAFSSANPRASCVSLKSSVQSEPIADKIASSVLILPELTHPSWFRTCGVMS